MAAKGGNQSWLFCAAIIVALEYGVALAIGFAHGFPYRIPFTSYFLVAALFGTAGAVGMILLRLVGYARRGIDSPIAALRADDWSRLVTFLGGILLIGMQMAVLMWTKTMMPLVAGFWADPGLAELESDLFGGDLWQVTQLLPDWASIALDRTYVTWAPVKFAVLFGLLLAPASARKGRLMLTYFLMVAAAALGQYLAPSGGPIFYELIGHGDRFADMPIEPWAATTRDFLWADYLRGGGQLGGGISAMPSLHVAIAAWCALVLHRYWPRLAFVGWAYAFVIFVGSVHLGWHYALDGIVSFALLIIAYAVAGTVTEDKPNATA